MQKQVRQRQAQGFSLFELLIVVTIFLILAGMTVIGTLTTSQVYKANNAMDAIVAEMRYGRQLAISLRRNVLVTFTAPNKIQLAVQTLPGEPPAAFIPPVYLNDGAKNGLTYTIVAPLDVPGGVGNGAPIELVDTTTGAAPAASMFNSAGTFVGSIALASYADVGNNDPVNGTIFIGIPNQPPTARAITILGSTGRVRTYTWAGTAGWQEQ